MSHKQSLIETGGSAVAIACLALPGCMAGDTAYGPPTSATPPVVRFAEPLLTAGDNALLDDDSVARHVPIVRMVVVRSTPSPMASRRSQRTVFSRC